MEAIELENSFSRSFVAVLAPAAKNDEYIELKAACALLSDLSVLIDPIKASSEAPIVNIVNISSHPLQVEIRVQGAPFFTAKDLREALQTIQLKQIGTWHAQNVHHGSLENLAHFAVAESTASLRQFLVQLLEKWPLFDTIDSITLSSLSGSDKETLEVLFNIFPSPTTLKTMISNKTESIAPTHMILMSVGRSFPNAVSNDISGPGLPRPPTNAARAVGSIQLRITRLESDFRVSYEEIKIFDRPQSGSDVEVVILDGGIDVSRTLTKDQRSTTLSCSINTIEITVMTSNKEGNEQWFAISDFQRISAIETEEIRIVDLFNRGSASDKPSPHLLGAERLMMASPTGFFFGGSKLQKSLLRHVKSPRRRPIFLIPGILGSRLYSKQDTNDLEWVDVLSFVRPGDLAERLSDPNQTVARPGRLEDIKSLNPHIGKTEVFMPLTQALKGDGLEFAAGRLLYGAPYDWRMSPKEMSSPGAIFQELKSRIEAAATANGSVVIGTHSMGTNTIMSFLLQDIITVEWIRTNIHALVTGGGPWLGAPKALLAASHGVRLINFPPIVSATRKMGNRLHSIRTLFPVGDWSSALPPSFIKDSNSYFFMNRSNSSLIDEDGLFREVQGEALEVQLEQKSLWYGPEDTGVARIEKFANKMQQAGVKVVCVYGTGTETPLSFVLAPHGSKLDVDTSFDSKIDGFTVKNGTVFSSSAAHEGGDGTVPLLSLCPPVLRDRTDDVFEFVDVPSVDHVGIVSSAEYGQYLVSFATAD